MARAGIGGLSVTLSSFSYEASSRPAPRRKCRGCGQRGGVQQTLASTNAGPWQQTLACARCGHTTTKEIPR